MSKKVLLYQVSKLNQYTVYLQFTDFNKTKHVRTCSITDLVGTPLNGHASAKLYNNIQTFYVIITYFNISEATFIIYCYVCCLDSCMDEDVMLYS